MNLTRALQLIVLLQIAAAAWVAMLLFEPIREKPPSELNVSALLAEEASMNAQLGVEYARNGRFELALEKLFRALEQDPHVTGAHNVIAFIYPCRSEHHSRLAVESARAGADSGHTNCEGPPRFDYRLQLTCCHSLR